MVKYVLYVLRWTVLAVPGALFFNQVREITGIQNVYAAMVISQALMGAWSILLTDLFFHLGCSCALGSKTSGRMRRLREGWKVLQGCRFKVL